MEVALGVIYLIVLVLLITSIWKLFVKCGEKGWASLIPVYNWVVLLRMANRKVFPSILLLLIPFVNIYIIFATYRGIGKRLGRGSFGFTLGMFVLPFIFFPILAFSNAE